LGIGRNNSTNSPSIYRVRKERESSEFPRGYRRGLKLVKTEDILSGNKPIVVSLDMAIS
jgi:hypothetical protein